MRAIAVHGLGGGFAYGVERSGAVLQGMLETDFARKTRRLNLDHVPEQRPDDDIYHFDPRGVDLVFGCPPCAGFSVAGSGLAQHDNPNHPINDGIRDWFRYVQALRPEIAVLESVPRTFLSEAGEALWKPLAQRHLAGYGICIVSYDNAQLGVPQKRVRTLLWAMRGGVPNVQLPGWVIPRWNTIQALDSLGTPATGWDIEQGDYWGHTSRPIKDGLNDWIMTKVPWGGNARKESSLVEIFDKLEAAGRQRPSFLWRRLHPQRPSCVLLADACERVAHYRGPEEGAGDALRYLSGREVARLMGYPDAFRLAGHLRRDVGPALCQAVSPAIGQWVGNEAGRLLEETDPYLTRSLKEPMYRDLTQVPTAGDSAYDLAR